MGRCHHGATTPQSSKLKLASTAFISARAATPHQQTCAPSLRQDLTPGADIQNTFA